MQPLRFRPLRAAAALLLGLGLAACSDDTQDLYAHHRAFFKYSPVAAVQPLYTALNNPGQFCAVTFETSHIRFASPTGQGQTVLRTAAEAYGKPESIAGFVVGTPSVPDLNLQYLPLAFDLACPACYEEALITKQLQFAGPEALSCGRCHRTYNLQNAGTLSQGEGTWRLFRYQVSYANDAVVIIN